MRKTNGEPYTRRLVRTVRGQAPGNLPSQGGKAPGAEPTIYNYLKCDKPFKRLWISSLTDKAIQEGLENLHDGHEYDNLYLAAEARSRADWLIGINASRALCITSGEGNNSLGRVQTPVLAMISQRYIENKNFESIPFYEILMKLNKGGEMITVKSNEQYFERKDADRIYNRLKTYPMVKVKNRVVKDISTDTPLLYDLTTLQKDCNTRHNLSAEKTLEIAQRLYEKKYITYPRTSSRYIPDDIYETIPMLISSLKNYPLFAPAVKTIIDREITLRSVDNSKVTDHHALLITGEPVRHLLPDEKTVYEMIAGRMLETYSMPHIKTKTTLEFNCDELDFFINGYQIKQNGWKSIFNLKDTEETIVTLPILEIGDYLPIESYNQVERKTQSQPIFTDATLLTAMETAGNTLDDKTKRETLKGIGIGTPATRSSIIETLIKRKYIIRSKKNLIPTSKGLFIFKSVKDMCISNVLLTADWEQTLNKIEHSPLLYETFIADIEEYTHRITDEILSIRLPEECSSLPSFPCPKCKKGMILFYHSTVRCKNTSCDVRVQKNILGVTLTQDQLIDLFKKGRTSLIKGFKYKNKEETFNASLYFDKDYKLKFDFKDDNKKSTPK